MTQWYVKEFSKLTKVSVRTLHHYDKIDLLKPSIRLENNYRVYSESDLLKLQQILALKFFGFELSQIKTLTEKEINVFDHFRAQQKFLSEKVHSLQAASHTLEVILSESDSHKSIPWKTILKLIEDYQMTKEIEHAWVKNVLNPGELVEYANFEKGLKTRFTEDEAKASREKWLTLINDIENNLDKDPKSDFGVEIGRRCMEWTDTVFTKEHAKLKKTLWEKGFKGGYSEVPPNIVAWLEEATSAYWKRRIYGLLDQVGMQSSKPLEKQWEDLLVAICGMDPAHRESVYEAVMEDNAVSQAAKEWLQKIKG